MIENREELLKLFKYTHLTDHLQKISKPFCNLANTMDDELKGPYLTACLRHLLEAKDAAILAALST